MMATAGQPVAAATAVASETVQFPSDGFTIKAFLARPILPAVPESTPQQSSGSADGLPAVLVLHEWWGLTDHIKDVTRRFASEGYGALAPDLYSRQGYKVTKEPEEASKLMTALSTQESLRDLNAAVRVLKSYPFVDPLRVGIVGFSMGGTLALIMAGHNSDLKACISFYGKVSPPESARYLVSPILYHYPMKDAWVTAQEVEQLRKGLEQTGKEGEVAEYPDCQHAFFNDTRLAVYRKEAAEKAWRRTLQFLANSLR